MNSAHSAQPTATSEQSPAARNLLARLALGFSVFAFLVPLGIAAIVLGHVSESRMAAGTAADNDKATARAALWIAYLQLAMVGLIVMVGWGLFHDLADGFRRDAMVQQVFRSSDQFKTLDPESAREAEDTARTLFNELIAIEDQAHRKDGAYICDVNLLTWTGLEGATDAEKSALVSRLANSPYIYEIRDCSPMNKDSAKDWTEPRYTLIAVPRCPRMPEGSAIFCTDQSGVIRSSRGRISLDCLNRDESSPVEPDVPRILK